MSSSSHHISRLPIMHLNWPSWTWHVMQWLGVARAITVLSLVEGLDQWCTNWPTGWRKCSQTPLILCKITPEVPLNKYGRLVSVDVRRIHHCHGCCWPKTSFQTLNQNYLAAVKQVKLTGVKDYCNTAFDGQLSVINGGGVFCKRRSRFTAL